jgi:hypothetical protein
MPHRKPPNPALKQDPDVVEMLSKSLAAMRLAEDKKREARWRGMQDDWRKKQTELAVQKEIEAKRQAHRDKLEKRQACYHVQKQLALKTLGPFMAFPAEVRNHIYAFCADAKPLESKFWTNKPNSMTIGEYFALSQVNKQIRVEFMPMHRRHIARAMMDPWKVVHFVDTFLPVDEPGYEQPSDTPRLEIAVSLDSFVNCVDHTQIPELDIKPLLELAIYQSELRFSFLLKRSPKRKNPKDKPACFQHLNRGCERLKCLPVRQLQTLFDESQKQGAGSAWAFFLAYTDRCELSQTAASKLELNIVVNEQYPVPGIAWWCDAWGFKLDTGLLDPLEAMEMLGYTIDLDPPWDLWGTRRQTGLGGIDITVGHARD